MIVSFNFYYALPGNEDAVLRQRLRASDVRQDLGIPRGRVLARVQGAANLPTVIWEHDFDAVAGHHADMAVRAGSPEFEAIRAGMRKLYRRFERPLFEVCKAGPAGEGAAPGGSVELAWFFCVPEKTADLLALLVRADNGGRLLRLITPGNELPELVWQRNHVDAASAERQRAWPAEVGSLAQRADHSIWKIA